MTKTRLILCCSALSISLLSGCGSKELHYWGDYEDSLYERYVENNPEQARKYLQETLEDAQDGNQRVAPGLYADYGFMLYQRGDKNQAIEFFEKEKQLYPESQALMTKLIERVKQQDIQAKEKDIPTNKEETIQ